MDLRTGRLSLVPVCNEATVRASNSFSNENGSIDSRQWLTPAPAQINSARGQAAPSHISAGSTDSGTLRNLQSNA